MSTKIKIVNPVIAVHARNWQVAQRALNELQRQVRELHALMWNSIYAAHPEVSPEGIWELDVGTMEVQDAARSQLEELLVAVMTGRRPSTPEDDGEPRPEDTIH